MGRGLWNAVLVLSLLVGLYFGWASQRAADMSPFWANTRAQLPAFPYPDRWIQDLFDWCTHRPRATPLAATGNRRTFEEWRTRRLVGAGAGAFLGVFVGGILLRARLSRGGNVVTNLLGRQHRPPAHCAQCDYDLAPSLAALRTACPECGHAYDPDTILAAQQFTPTWWGWSLGIAGLVACVHWLLLLALLTVRLLSLEGPNTVEALWWGLLWPGSEANGWRLRPEGFCLMILYMRTGFWTMLVMSSLGWGVAVGGIFTLWRERWPILTAVWEHLRPPTFRS